VRPVADRLHAEAPFDLIHAHFIYPDGVAAARLARRYGIPFVVTDQAPWYPWLEHRCVRQPAVAAARDAAALTCVSSYLRDTMRGYLGEAVPIEIIPNGVDEEEFAAPELPLVDRDEQVLFVGFVNFNKGVDTLIAAMERVVASRPQARLVIVGGSFYRKTRLEEEQLRAIAVGSKVSTSVTFVGRQGPAEVARLMRESSVFVLPSRAETFGAVLVEALASGTPVVATRSGGPEDFVNDAVGRLVPIGDAEALGAAIVQVLEQRTRYDSDALRRYALDNFRWSAIAARYVALYERILGVSIGAEPGLTHVATAQR
jgi:glycosyltransferase involved in cell wall biosynthesis